MGSKPQAAPPKARTIPAPADHRLTAPGDRACFRSPALEGAEVPVDHRVASEEGDDPANGFVVGQARNAYETAVDPGESATATGTPLESAGARD